MDLEAVKNSLEESNPTNKQTFSSTIRPKFYDALVLNGLSIDAVEHGRVLCSLAVSPCLRNDRNYLHGGVIATYVDLVGSAVFIASGYPTSGVSLELNVSHLDAAFVGEEIEVEAKLLHPGKTVGVVMVEVRKRKTGKLIAQARHTKYLAVASKL